MIKTPKPPSLFLHTVSNQKLGGGKAWEQGYPIHVNELLGVETTWELHVLIVR